jgi:cell division protein FtsI/penicillin-binding protein 2
LSTPEADGERRRRLLTRTVPLVVLALAAFLAGLLVGNEPDAPGAERFLAAWEAGDTKAMHAELTTTAREEHPLGSFQAAYAQAAETATIASLSVGEQNAQDDVVRAPVSLRTRAFGALQGEIELPLEAGGVAWDPRLVFPGLEAGEKLARRTRAPARAPILAADGGVLAKGSAAARTLPLAGAASVAGSVGAPSPARARELAARGFPPGTLAGISGLELAFDTRLAGTPGGELLARSEGPGAERVLATSKPSPGRAVRATIDPEVQEAAVAALGSLFGGIAVLDARNGSVLALAGVAYSAPQPPGSTFKIVTTTGALDSGVVALSDRFPVETSNSEIGREISNSDDSLCGGTFAESFANSCNTVFAPLGAELGGEKLVETAEKFGWNALPTLFDARATAAVDPPASTIPERIETSIEAGESAIGQGQVLATPLQMASVAQTIAAGGIRSPTAIARSPELAPDADPVRVTSAKTASTIRDLMVGVVERGTGTAAAIPDVAVAGKTGTAELGPSALEPGQELAPGEDPPLEKDAWFTAFAPAAKPSLAVAVMIVNAEADGGVVAAPIAREVLATGLGVE